MVSFFAKRFGALILTMLIVSFLVFITFEFSPGDVARNALGPFATEVQLEKYRQEFGLNRPFMARYLSWLGVAPNHKGEISGLLQGNFGYSTLWKTQVNTFVWDRILNTALLAGVAFAVIAPLSIILGVAAGMREGSLLDRVVSVLSAITTSIPEFAMGAFLVTIFVVGFRILPGTAPLETGGGGWSIASQLVLPVATLTAYYLGYLVRMVRASMVEVMTRPYIRTAVLKGLTFRGVVMKHAIRNALITPFTAILLQLNFLFTSVVVVETVFGFPGFGRMLVEAALYKDVLTVETATLFAVFVVVITQVIGDLSYMLLNPRIRFS
ncbi:MAG TPA: ABC transporter permease [Alphaproteobacteria bacterium]|nr:ABC transporter permease [Alphaproteobacteria bacterium]